MLKKIQKEVEDLRVKVYAGQSLEDTEKALYEIEQMLFKAMDEQLNIPIISKRYFLFQCVNADKQKLKKLIIAPDRETAIADIETNYPYIIKWYSSEELNVC